VAPLGRKDKPKEPLGPYGKVGKSIAELDERLGIAKGGRTFLDKIFPDHWSFMLGEIALYSFVVLLATGVFLCFFYVPSVSPTVCHTPYSPVDGTITSQAFCSTVNLSFSVRAGLLMRQMHHWACDIFVGSIVLHMARVFFTGAFRKPRELNWTIGLTMLILAILNGFIGYSLPDDLISGTGIRIAFSIVLSIPIVGSYLAFFLFGGNFPGTAIIPRFFFLHVLILPAVIVGLLSAHLFLLVRQKHTQFPGPGKTERNVVGSPMYPVFIAKTTGFLFMIAGVTALLGALFQINPIWQFGSYKASNISYAVQPDWYMGWLDGALRVMPSWEFVGFGHTIPFEVLLPAIIFPGIIFNICYLWPMIERRRSKDLLMHNLLFRPRDRPKHTAAGAAMLWLLGMLFIASATDVLANFFHVSLNSVLILMRILIVVTPFVCYFVTWKICLELAAVPKGGKRKVANVVTLTERGEYVATPMPPPPGTEDHELAPEYVPALLELDDGRVDDGGSSRPDDEEPSFGTSSVRTVPR
jgi:ubiquinol-cytochrome c reductase cytochrome b subunit